MNEDARKAVAAGTAAAVLALPVFAATTEADSDVSPLGDTGTTTETTPPDPQVAQLEAELELARAREKRMRKRAYRLRLERNRLRRRWTPTVEYALRLASAVTGVPYGEMKVVARCESTLSPGAVNGRYRGLFQLGWSPFGFSPFDPVANAISAGMTVAHDGGWRQWQCKP